MFRIVAVAMLVAGVAGLGTMLALAPSVAAQGSPSATRSFSPATVSPGGRVTVTITAANYGSVGGVTETLPVGFIYVSSSLDSEQVDVDPRQVKFTLQEEPSFTYTVTAPHVEGPHAFSGTLRDSERNEHAVGGAATVTVSSGDPLVARYDANGNGTMEKSEVIRAINDYLFGGGDPITKAEVIRLINLYLFGPATAQPPGAPTGLTATANGQTRIDLSWRAPANDGGAAITGYRVAVSTDRSSWSSLVSNTGSTATRYSHTGLTAGSTRHYQVSAINPAGTGPVSNVATATTSASGSPAVGPDLVVDAPTVSDSSPDAGASFTLSAAVRNQGNGPSDSTTLRYYRSADSTISTGDTPVGTDPVGGLAALGSSSESIGLTAPSSAGTYYYSACVDAVNGESNTGNNCSVAVRATVVGAPDLVVQSASVSDNSPDVGASFTLRATVRNQGGSPSSSTFLRYYRSPDPDITAGDRQVGKDPVGGLAASGTSNESISLTAPSSAGTYYYGACVQPLPNESNGDNNCSDAVRVTVVGAPDLVVQSPSVEGDSSLTAGASFTLSVTVHNQGNGPSDGTPLQYYLSTNQMIASDDTLLDTGWVDPVPVAGSRSLSIKLTAPSVNGTHFYGACVQPFPNESNKDNNCSDAVAVMVDS